jgi:uncharacterized protein YbgA (DUF1722 family)/uncharacterized protein YbbK (DUF523 family)
MEAPQPCGGNAEMTSIENPLPAAAPLRIGVSACLLGQEVRFDGGHKRSDFLVDIFGPFVEFVPVCPELDIGLGVPRETLRLVRDGGDILLLGNKSGADRTAAMQRYSERRTAALVADDLSGYVLKKDSPSCGMERVRIYAATGMPARDGRGLYAAALIRRFPNLPIEEEGRLNDARLRENFIERVFAYRRIHTFFAGRWTIGGLVALHTAHKLQLLAHAPRAYSELGRMVAQASTIPRAELRERYESGFMDALAKIATVARHVNVLQHMTGYFRDRLDPESRRELAAVIEDYRARLIPLIVPITLVRHHVRTLDIAYLNGQLYLQPHPKELMLRNHV